MSWADGAVTEWDKWHMAWIDSRIKRRASEGYKMLDRLTGKHFDLSADEFIVAWQAGKFHDENEHPEGVRLAMMIPLVPVSKRYPGAER